MSINIEGAELSEITIAGKRLKVPRPFVEGHVLRANEAAALNQVYAENIRNNFASVVKAETEKAEKEGIALDEEALQAKLDAYVAEYEFGVRRAGAPRVTMDPVEREALAIARDKIKDALKKKGHKVSDFSKEKIDEMAKDLVEKYPQIREHAKRVVAVKAEVGKESLEIET